MGKRYVTGQNNVPVVATVRKSMGDREKHEQFHGSPRRSLLSRSESRREWRAAAYPFGITSTFLVVVAGTLCFTSCVYWIVVGLLPGSL